MLRNALELASTLAGHSVGILEFLQDEALLGQTLASATTADGSREVSAWLVAQRRSVLRSFIELVEPELRREGLGDAGDALVRALRSVAEPVGTGYRLPGGKPRGRGGPTPSIEDHLVRVDCRSLLSPHITRADRPVQADCRSSEPGAGCLLPPSYPGT